jgi:choline-sulfatase
VHAGIEFLTRGRDRRKPFCLYLPLVVPHCPFTVPQPYYDMYNPNDVSPLRPTELSGKPAFYRRIRETRGLDRTPEKVFRKLNAVYCGTITLIDELLGRLLDTLDETGLAENTTVMVFSDHGDWAGDFGLVEKWSSGLDDCLVRSPLVIRTPGGTRGHVVNEPVEVFDQMATILELAGIEARHNHFARSLVAQLHGATGDPERAVFAEGGYDPHEPHAFEAFRGHREPGDPRGIYYPKLALQAEEPLTNARCAMIRTSTHKLVRRPATGEHELYDLAVDPLELENVYGREHYGAVQCALEARMLDWYVQTADVVPFDADPRGMPERSVYWRRLTVG